MPSYDVAIASLAIAAPRKWTDNAITQNSVPNVSTEQRGIARRIDHSALLHLAVARVLHTELGLSVRDALTVGSELLAGPESIVERDLLTLKLDLRRLEATVAERLAEALESAPRPARGRPPTRT